ncbi:hypothetical protein NE850_02080 [Paraburkholderia sp. USG1]|nr:hypothetical protein [Paraburkholderia sp. USG1]MDR8395112.1 hypothetical protein [Paraburkholderia sp. USG1]
MRLHEAAACTVAVAEYGKRFRTAARTVQGVGHFVRRAAVCRIRKPVGRRASRGLKAAPHTSARTSKLAAHIQ